MNAMLQSRLLIATAGAYEEHNGQVKAGV